MVAFVPRPSYSNSANNLFASSCDSRPSHLLLRKLATCDPRSRADLARPPARVLKKVGHGLDHLGHRSAAGLHATARDCRRTFVSGIRAPQRVSNCRIVTKLYVDFRLRGT